MCGVLYKKGKKMKGWKKRYFELREHFLFFYSKKEEVKPKGSKSVPIKYIENE